MQYLASCFQEDRRNSQKSTTQRQGFSSHTENPSSHSWSAVSQKILLISRSVPIPNSSQCWKSTEELAKPVIWYTPNPNPSSYKISSRYSFCGQNGTVSHDHLHGPSKKLRRPAHTRLRLTRGDDGSGRRPLARSDRRSRRAQRSRPVHHSQCRALRSLRVRSGRAWQQPRHRSVVVWLAWRR